MGDSIRNIERLEEGDEDDRAMPRGVVLSLLVFGGGCALFTAISLVGRSSTPLERKTDPLGDLLVQRARAASSVPATELSPKDVTFPGILSDDQHPPTALAAVRTTGASAPAPGAAASSSGQAQPPPPTDRLSVVPLPAQNLIEATPAVTRPRDSLTRAAEEGDRAASGSAETAPAGHEGGYQLQVSSFHTQGEAQTFAEQLRARGHKAYVVEANVPGRGVWYRVRIGPFTTQRAAAEYRTSFEDREHVVPFIVLPETTARARQ